MPIDIDDLVSNSAIGSKEVVAPIVFVLVGVPQTSTLRVIELGSLAPFGIGISTYRRADFIF